MKRLRVGSVIVFIMILFMTIFISCSKHNDANSISETESKDQLTKIPTSAPTAEPTITATAAPAEAAEKKTAKEKDPDIAALEEEIAKGPMKIRDISSVELVKEMNIGWNLGNTMDSSGTGKFSEISWGNPLTKKAMIDKVREAGFNTLRIPVTWQQHMGPAPDYIIDKAWLDRVQEVVNYGIADGMYVIINMHHEDWHCLYYDKADAAIDQLKKAWLQIADRFENYDEHLIFEGMNEPRQNGAPDEWIGGNKEGWDVINRLNAAFIDTIRNAGGNNPLRHLMIPPYAASSSTMVWENFEVPEDEKVIVSIHAYTPYNFALNISGTADWSISNKNDTYEIDTLVSNIKEYFLNKGIPVILGEFGALDKNNTESRVAWAEYYVKKAKENGIVCIVWDNGKFLGSGELLGLLDRSNLTWKYPEIIEAFMKGIK